MTTKPDAATQALIDAAVAEREAELEAEHDTAIAGLKKKNVDLIADNKKLKLNGGATPEDASRLETLETENERLTRENTKLTNDNKKLTKDNQTLTTERDTEKSFAERTVIQNELTRDLIANNVDPELLPGALALLERDAGIKVEGKDRKAVFGDRSSGDFIKEWAGAAGKRFTVAPVNGGGGSNNSQPNNTGVAKKYSEMSEAERVTLHNTNKPEFDRVLAEHQKTTGTPELAT